MQIGTIIGFLHDWADLPGCITKVLGASIYPDLAAFQFLLTIAVWGYTRLFVLPQMVYWIMSEFTYGPGFEQFNLFLQLNGIFLLVLVGLHLFWFYLFFRILFKYLATGVVKDEQSIVQKTSSPGKEFEVSHDSVQPPTPRKKPAKLD